MAEPALHQFLHQNIIHHRISDRTAQEGNDDAGKSLPSRRRVNRKIVPSERLPDEDDVPCWLEPSFSLWFHGHRSKEASDCKNSVPPRQSNPQCLKLKCKKSAKQDAKSMTNLPLEKLEKRLEDALKVKESGKEDDKQYSVKICRERNKSYDVSEVRSFMNKKRDKVKRQEVVDDGRKECRKKYYDVEAIRKYMKRQHKNRSSKSINFESPIRICNLNNVAQNESYVCNVRRKEDVLKSANSEHEAPEQKEPQTPNQVVETREKSMTAVPSEISPTRENMPIKLKKSKKNASLASALLVDTCEQELSVLLKGLMSNFKECEKLLLSGTLPKTLIPETHNNLLLVEKSTQTTQKVNTYVTLPSVDIEDDTLPSTDFEMDLSENNNSLVCLSCDNIPLSFSKVSTEAPVPVFETLPSPADTGANLEWNEADNFCSVNDSYQTDVKRVIDDQMSKITWHTLHTMVFEEFPESSMTEEQSPSEAVGGFDSNLNDDESQGKEKLKIGEVAGNIDSSSPLSVAASVDVPVCAATEESFSAKYSASNRIEQVNSEDSELPSLDLSILLPSSCSSLSVTERVNEIRRKRNLDKGLPPRRTQSRSNSISLSSPKDLMRLTPIIDFDENDFECSTVDEVSECSSFSVDVGEREMEVVNLKGLVSFSDAVELVPDSYQNLIEDDSVNTRIIVDTVETIAECICDCAKSGGDWHWSMIEQYSHASPAVRAYKLFLCDLCKYIVDNEFRSPLEKTKESKSLHEIVKLLRKPVMTYEPKSLCNILKSKVLSLINEYSNRQIVVKPDVNKDGLVGFWKRSRKKDLVDSILMQELRSEDF